MVSTAVRLVVPPIEYLISVGETIGDSFTLVVQVGILYETVTIGRQAAVSVINHTHMFAWPDIILVAARHHEQDCRQD